MTGSHKSEKEEKDEAARKKDMHLVLLGPHPDAACISCMHLVVLENGIRTCEI